MEPEKLPFILNDVPRRHIPEPFRSFFNEVDAKRFGYDPSVDIFDKDNYHSHYLKSKLWRRIKRRILKRDNHICFRCKGEAKEVHHKSYLPSVLRGERDDQLVSLCRGCHEYIHTEGNRIFSSEDVEKRLNAPFVPKEVELMPQVIQTKRGPRKRHQFVFDTPPEWETMSAIERKSYRERQFKQMLEFAAERKKRKAAREAKMKKPKPDSLPANTIVRSAPPFVYRGKPWVRD
jgi:hypothetical protein